MFYALREALLSLPKRESRTLARHRRCHKLFVDGIEAMGLRMHVPAEHRIATLNTVCVPKGVDEAKVENGC